ncbi:MAG: MYXO-CTERM domain-containing protein [Myxococcota bacterium]|jgi:MYXO-CTERM domain-containing protein
MNRLSFVSFAVLFAVPAMAQEITESVADVNFEVEQTSFRGAEDRVVYIPADTAFRIKVSVDVDADVAANMEGESTLEWPEAMTQSWEGVLGGGEAEVDLTMSFDVGAEFAGILNLPDFIGDLDFRPISEGGTGSGPIYYGFVQEEWAWFQSVFFDSLLLPGSPTPSLNIPFDFATDSSLVIWSFDVGNIDFEVFSTGYFVQLGGMLQVTPDSVLVLSGENISTRGRQVTEHEGTVVVPAPTVNDGTATYESVWTGSLASTFAVIAGFVPEIIVGTTFDANGDVVQESGVSSTITGLLAGYIGTIAEVNVPIATDLQQIVSKQTPYTHDLPAIDTDQSSLDFGSILIDTESQLNLTVEDLGAIELWGDISIEGEGFSISRPDLEVEAEGEAMVTVTFRPGATGNFDGILTMESNDPVNPVVAIPLSGNGFDETGDTGENNDTGDGPDGSAGIRGCGCSSAPGGSLAWLALIPAFGFVLRRRR